MESFTEANVKNKEKMSLIILNRDRRKRASVMRNYSGSICLKQW